MLLQCLLLLQLTAVVFSAGVKCFCDHEMCDDNMLCQGEFCFIGLRKGDGEERAAKAGQKGRLAVLNAEAFFPLAERPSPFHRGITGCRKDSVKYDFNENGAAPRLPLEVAPISYGCEPGTWEPPLACRRCQPSPKTTKEIGRNGDSPRLRQHCGSATDLPFLAGPQPRCEERVDEWHEICTCTSDFCNTFAYLRSSIDSRQHSADVVSFTKQEPTIVHSRPDPPPRNQNSSVVVLLVIIPLAVGGFAVCLIFLNYHCKMC